MNEIKDLLFNSENTQISALEFVFYIFLAAALSAALGFFYTRYGNSFSNRKAVAGTLILICVTTMIIITIVKSSLALSLGLVGALSIVRFRTAIKDPEELAYFFIAIAIGLGMGAGQVMITLSGSLFIFVLIFVRRFAKNREVIQNLSLTLHKPESGFDFKEVIEKLKESCTQLELRRLDESEGSIEITLFVRFNSFDKLLESKSAIQRINNRILFSYLENI